MVTDPVTGLCRKCTGGVRSRSWSTHGQPTSGAVSVVAPRAGSGPRITGDAPVVTSADSTEPGGVTAWTSTVTRSALPLRMTGAGARGASSRASSAGGRVVNPGRHAATRANRCGSTASTVSPELLLDRLV